MGLLFKSNDMAIEISKINWFEGLSQNVICANCEHWKRDSGHLEDPNPSHGNCDVKDMMTLDDFFCKYFMLKVNVG